MREGSRANALLVELLLVILFFMISAAIIVQVFADAKMKSRTAHITNASMMEAENLADELYHADNPEELLANQGFTSENGEWVLQRDEYLLKVTKQEEETGSGILRTYSISGMDGDKTLLTLPSARYIPKEVSP